MLKQICSKDILLFHGYSGKLYRHLLIKGIALESLDLNFKNWMINILLICLVKSYLLLMRNCYSQIETRENLSKNIKLNLCWNILINNHVLLFTHSISKNHHFFYSETIEVHLCNYNKRKIQRNWNSNSIQSQSIS